MNLLTEILQIVGYLACGLVLTSLAANNTVYASQGAMQAAGAGFILLSMVIVSKAGPNRCSRVWISY